MSRKTNTNCLNRGRFQAQGNGREQSRPWAEKNIPTKDDGKDFLNELQGKLKPSEIKVRSNCFDKAYKWVDNAPRRGYVVDSPIKTSFLPTPPIKDIRVDGELYSGVAFKNKD